MASTVQVIEILSAFLFIMGLLLVLLRRNTIFLLLGLELILNSVNLSLIGFSKYWMQVNGQVQVFFVITLAAAESAIGLSILVNLYRHFGQLRTDVATTLKG